MVDSDVEKNRIMAIVGYLFPIFFFVPLITEGKDSPFARFHANQQLLLLISGVVLYIAGLVILPIGLLFISLICSLAWVVLLVVLVCKALWLVLAILGIIGIINVWRGEMKPLPAIGGTEIIK